MVVYLATRVAPEPWRECLEDDVAAGCVALPQDTAGTCWGWASSMEDWCCCLSARDADASNRPPYGVRSPSRDLIAMASVRLKRWLNS